MRLALAVSVLAALHLPVGYHASVYATGLEHPTALSFGPDQRLYVSEDVGNVVSVARGTSRPRPFLRKLVVPLGLLWRGRTLYVSESGRVDAFGTGGRRIRSCCRICPTSSTSRTRSSRGRTAGSISGRARRAMRAPSRIRAAPRFSRSAPTEPDSTWLRAACGTRTDCCSSARRCMRPSTGATSSATPSRRRACVNVRQGANFGWPGCWPSFVLKRLAGVCTGVTAPIAYLEPHSSADGIASWHGDLFVAEWGEYLSTKHGRLVVRIKRGRVTTFATGFDHPLALAVDPAATCWSPTGAEA